jgi:hypothetical protein
MTCFHCPISKQRTGEMSHKLLEYIYIYIYIRRYCISQMIRKELPALYPSKSGVNKKDILQQSKGHRELHIMA